MVHPFIYTSAQEALHLIQSVHRIFIHVVCPDDLVFLTQQCHECFHQSDIRLHHIRY